MLKKNKSFKTSMDQTKFGSSFGSSFALKKQRFGPVLTDHLSLGRVPPEESILKSSKGQKIEKLCVHSEWQPRFLYITADKLLIIHPEFDNEISDQIPLVMYLDKTREQFALNLLDQHEITSSDRTIDGPCESQIWIINTAEKGYNNGRQVHIQLLSVIIC